MSRNGARLRGETRTGGGTGGTGRTVKRRQTENSADFDSDETRDRDIMRLLPGIERGDIDAIIEYLGKYGGKEWRAE